MSELADDSVRGGRSSVCSEFQLPVQIPVPLAVLRLPVLTTRRGPRGGDEDLALL